MLLNKFPVHWWGTNKWLTCSKFGIQLFAAVIPPFCNQKEPHVEWWENAKIWSQWSQGILAPKENRASLCFFASTHKEGLLIWLICLPIVKCPPVCITLGKHSRYVWAVYLKSLGNLLCFWSLPLIAFQLGNKIVFHWCLYCSLRWYSTFIPSERKLTLRCEVTLLSSYSQPKLISIRADAREPVASQWPTAMLVSELTLT